MEIKYFAYIRDYAKEKQTTWEAPADDLADLLKQLSDRYGSKFREAVFDETLTELNPLIVIIINGRHVTHLDGIHTKLAKSDTISIFPVVAGG